MSGCSPRRREWRRSHSQVSFRHSRRVVEKDIDFNLETFFEFGLQRMLDGLAVLISGSRRLGVPGEGVGTLR